MTVRITRLHNDVTLPTYQTPGSVAFDLAPCETISVGPRETGYARTGLVIATPPGHALLLAPRSSLYKKKGLRLGNTIGIIDQDYCGPEDELMIALWNPGDTSVTVEKGERVAQGLFLRVDRAAWDEQPITTSSSRGGWGSTGA